MGGGLQDDQKFKVTLGYILTKVPLRIQETASQKIYKTINIKLSQSASMSKFIFSILLCVLLRTDTIS